MKKSFRANAIVPALSFLALAIPITSQAQTIELDPMVVSAARMPQTLSEASVIVDVISRQEIEQSGASNITEFLDSVSGLTISRLYGRTGVDVSVDVGYLGEAGSQNVLILIDGQRINSIDSARTRFSQLPLGAIQQIEIRKANGGVLYGDRAQGGVINIITRSDPLKVVELTYGSFGYQSQDVYLGFDAENLQGSISLMNTKSDGYRVHSESDQQSAQLHLNSDLGLGFVSFFLRGFQEKAKLPSFLTKSQFEINPRLIGKFPESSERTGISSGIKYELFLEDNRTLQINTTYQESKDKGYSTIKNTKTSITPEFRTVILGNKAVLGSEFFNAEANSKQGKQVAQKSQAIFTHLIHPVSQFTDFDIGLRLQKVESQFQTGVGENTTSSSVKKAARSLGFRTKIGESSTFRMGVLTGFRFPNADELYYFGQASPFRLLEINQSIIPTTTKEHFLQYQFSGKSINLSAHYRHIYSKDEIGFLFSCGDAGGVPASCNANLYNTDRSIFSLSAGWKVNRAALLKGSVDFVDASIASGLNQGNRIPLTPKQVIRMSFEQRVNGFTFIASANYRTDMTQAGDQTATKVFIPSRTVADFGVKAHFSPDVSGSFWIRNAFNKSYYDYATSDGIYPTDGRSLFLSLKVGF